MTNTTSVCLQYTFTLPRFSSAIRKKRTYRSKHGTNGGLLQCTLCTATTKQQMKSLFFLSLMVCSWGVFAQTDTLRSVPPDTLPVPQSVTNHPPQLLHNEPEILWFTNFRQVVTYQFPAKGFYRDQEGHEVAFRMLTKNHAGLRLTPEGLFTAQLSMAEYRNLPLTVEYEIFETNTSENLSAKGQIILQKTKNDLPPIISIWPKTLRYAIEETDSVAIKIAVTDPNDDLSEFELYSSVQYGKFNPSHFLTKTAEHTYWFRWQPGYDFVQLRNVQEEPKRAFQLVFEAKDEADSTTRVAIDIEVFDKTDWSIADKVRQQEFEQVIGSATEALVRLEKTFQMMDKDIKKMYKNKKLRASLSASLRVLSQNEFLRNKVIGEDQERQNWLGVINEAQEDRSKNHTNEINIEQEYPAEFAKIQRFSGIVAHLRNIYVDTELFANRYSQTENRRNEVFSTEKETLQKNISSVLKDNSLGLQPLTVAITAEMVKHYFIRK